MEGCRACDEANGRGARVPGGVIFETSRWCVDHCYGPLGVGTLIVKPKRHVVHVADLSRDEAADIGPLLQQAAGVVAYLSSPDQVYVCLGSHAGRDPVHIRFVVPPVTSGQRDRLGGGPRLQAAMFDAGGAPDTVAVEEYARRARLAFAR